MNESIARSRTRGSPRWREKTMMITCSNTPDISLHESLYHPQHPWVGVLHQMNAKNVFQRNWIKSVWRAISRLWGIPERDPCMQIEEDNLVENLQCTAEAWWRFPITSRWLLRRSDLMMTEEVPHGYVPVLQLWYSPLFTSTRSLHSVQDYSTSITLSMMKSRKEKVILQYISPQMSQISIHFGKAHIQDERTCILKLELVEITLLTGREDSPS